MAGSYIKRSNNKDVQVSKTVMRSGEIHFQDTVNLRANLYDFTEISFDRSDLPSADCLDKFTIIIEEAIGDIHKSVTFRMSDFSNGNSDYSEEAIYYQSSFTLDSSTGLYTLPIYIAARCSNGNKRVGFNDCVVTLESSELDLAITYRTWLPPTLNQGIPYKQNRNDADPVFPNTATRVDIGVGLINDYIYNAHGYTEDYIFSNSGPLYEVEASGFMPSSLEGNSFTDLNSYLINDITTQKISIPIVSNTKSSKNIEVMNSALYGSFKDTFVVTKLVQSLISARDKTNMSTIKNRLVITGSVYNQEEPDIDSILTQDDDEILTQGSAEEQYILLQ